MVRVDLGVMITKEWRYILQNYGTEPYNLMQLRTIPRVPFFAEYNQYILGHV